MERDKGKVGNSRRPGLKILLGALGAAWGLAALAGCGKDCREAVRLGDFEYSQGNYANAAKRYEQALRDDPKCYNVEAKLKDARGRAAGK
jgi:hypothetical protein